jgi:hypothetical protein
MSPMRSSLLPIGKAGARYFGMVFAAGFLLGTIRVLWLVPRIGARAAELMEMPIMLLVILLAARDMVRRLPPPRGDRSRLGAGLLALGLLLVAELTLVLALRGLTLPEYLAGRDPVSGTVYAALLGVFALMPLFVARHHRK